MKTKTLLIIAFCTAFTLQLNAKPILTSRRSAKHAIRLKKRYSTNELVNNLQYDFSRSAIRTAYNDRLDQLAELITEKKFAVALRGHADSIGTYKGNWVLSQKRSDAVKDYLVKKGVPSNLIISTAFGSTEPIASNKTAAGRQENRRVEIKLKPIEQ